MKKLSIKVTKDLDLTMLVSNCNFMSDLTEADRCKLSIICSLELLFNCAVFNTNVWNFAVHIDASNRIRNWDVNHVDHAIIHVFVWLQGEGNRNDAHHLESLELLEMPEDDCAIEWGGGASILICLIYQTNLSDRSFMHFLGRLKFLCLLSYIPKFYLAIRASWNYVFTVIGST